MPMLTVEKLNDVVNQFDVDGNEFSTFVETGTYIGDTVRSIQPYFDVLHTIEISEYLYEKFLREHPAYGNVIIHRGDSSDIIPQLMNKFDENTKCVFWLDGHFSNGCTSKGEKDVPLIEECKSIDSLYKADEALVLIDDLRLFGTDHAEDWSEISVENILNCFENFKVVNQYEHPDDMFCLYIRRKK
jgi:hypothetical protein